MICIWEAFGSNFGWDTSILLMLHGFPLHTCLDWNSWYKCILLVPKDDTAEG
jgi:hypothetical protein